MVKSRRRKGELLCQQGRALCQSTAQVHQGRVQLPLPGRVHIPFAKPQNAGHNILGFVTLLLRLKCFRNFNFPNNLNFPNSLNKGTSWAPRWVGLQCCELCHFVELVLA
eukprot:2803366-Amphidinium_carterae.1